jgi:hypothetical protein
MLNWDYSFGNRKRGGGIPKRGSKDFEPDGSENQHDALASSLNALQKALSEERNVSRYIFLLFNKFT